MSEISPWIQDFNTLIREVIFVDDELKRLMKIPEGTKIIDFIDRYFIRAGYTTKLLSNEAVRIVYGSVNNGNVEQNVTANTMYFEIYVKNDDLHNADRDRLVMRTQLIADRLIYLLTKKRYNGVYRFFNPREGDSGTSAIGYARYTVSFSYLRSY